MKITSLKLKNIHSLRGEHEIDFANGALAEAGLFAITGPTGAGKSTLLDAITLALFKSIPRVGRISPEQIKSQGIILTHHTDECYAEVTFNVNGKDYLAHWSIAKTRTGENFRSPKHELSDAATGKIICDRYSDTVKEVEATIGLSYDQFVKAMLLAQGEFAKLLKADAKSRDQLLEDITGAHIYRRIGKAVYERHKHRKQERDQTKLILDQIEIFDEDTRKGFVKEVKELMVAVKALEKELKAINNIIEVKKKREDLLQREDKVNKRLERWQDKQAQWTENSKRLEFHEQLAPFREPLQAIRLLEKEQTQIVAAIEKTEKALANAKENQVKAETVAKELLGKLPADFHRELREFRDQINALDDAIAQQKNTYKNQVDAFERLRKSLAKRLGIFDEDKNADYWLTHIDAAQKAQGIFNEDALESALQKIDLREGLLRSFADQQKMLNLYQSNLQDLLEEHQKANEKHTENLENLQKLRQKLDDEIPRRDALKREVEQRKREAGLEAQRADLQEGEACPLCGSTEHPYAEHLPELDKTRELLLAELDKNISLWEKEVIGLQTRTKDHDGATNALNEKIKATEKNITSCNDDMATLRKKLNWSAKEAPLQKETEGLKNQRAEINRLGNQMACVNDLKDVQELEKALPDLDDQIQEKSKHRRALYSGSSINDDVADCIQKRDQALEAMTRLQEELGMITTSRDETSTKIEKKTTALLREVSAFGIADLDDLAAGILSEKEAGSLRTQAQALKDEKQSIEGERKSIAEQLADIVDQDERSLEMCTQEQQNITQTLENHRSNITRINTRLEQDDANRAKRADMEKDLAEQGKALEVWHKLNIMIGDATGAKFSSFVQRLTLKQLLLFANDRLQGLSDRYRLFYTDDNDTLMVEDLHLGSTTRTVSSLSGGETFKLSLALALGLSDLAAQNVKIESLFIDEGFGTLDNDSLNEAIATLENLQSQGSKSVGIISHVEELKERLSAKIQVTPTGKGYSRVEVVSS